MKFTTKKADSKNSSEGNLMTSNHGGASAIALSGKTALYTKALTTFVSEPTYYVGSDSKDNSLVSSITEVSKTDPEFILKLAYFARKDMNMRSVSILLLVEAARIQECRPFVRRWTPKIIRRADELIEVVGYWTKNISFIGSSVDGSAKKMVFPNSLKKGLADAFDNFSEYQFEKYNKKGKTVSFADVIRICHPKPDSDEKSALLKYLLTGEVEEQKLPLVTAKQKLSKLEELSQEALDLIKESSATWEVVISQFGNKKEVWEACVPNMGYMAKLRNIRNMHKSDIDISSVLSDLSNKEAVVKSKQLPFRFLSAYRELEGSSSEILSSISDALAASVSNLPKIKGKTLIVSDNSASMFSPISRRSSVSCADVSHLLASVANSLCEEAICSVFGSDFMVVPLDNNDSIIGNMKKLSHADVGHSTKAHLAMDWLIEKSIKVDRIMLLSDMQCHKYLGDRLDAYRSAVSEDAYMYSIDLVGYGTSQFPEEDKRTALISGWSEKVLSFIPMFEDGSGELLSVIEAA